MKKVFALILSVVMLMSLFAGCRKQETPAETGTAPAETVAVENEAADAVVEPGERDPLTPELTEESEKIGKLYSKETISELSEEIQNVMAEAEEELKYVDSKGLALKYFFHTEILTGEETVSVSFEPIPHNEILFMQFLDGMWVTLEHEEDENGILTVADMEKGPMAIFADSMDSPSAKPVDLVPILTEETHLYAQVHTLEESVTLSEEAKGLMEEAKEQLKTSAPEGFAAKYFFYFEILNEETSVSAGFEPIEHDEIVFMHYVDGAWTELTSTTNSDGTHTVDGVAEAPAAVLVK